METALTIAGSDSGGGAGIQADLKTFEAFGVYGTTVITALTAQNTTGVQKVWASPLEMVQAQMLSVLGDFDIRAVKTGMLFSADIIDAVAATLRGRNLPLVVDPVMVATSGESLLQRDAVAALKSLLIPQARIVTPNRAEAEILADMQIVKPKDMEAAAIKLSAEFPGTYILVKGGHLLDDGAREKSATDLLCFNGKIDVFTAPYIDTHNTHGTGCTLSAAITANMAKGMDVHLAVSAAKRFVTDAIRYSWNALGKGRGTLRHNFQKLKSAG